MGIIVWKFKTPRSGVQTSIMMARRRVTLAYELQYLLGWRTCRRLQSPARLYGLTRWGDDEVCSPGRSMVNVR
jgi:hypothetical protein